MSKNKIIYEYNIGFRLRLILKKKGFKENPFNDYITRIINILIIFFTLANSLLYYIKKD